MKKLSLFLVLALILSAFGAFAETETPIENPTEAFVGRWADPVYGRASLSIIPADVEDAAEDGYFYDIGIIWGDSVDSVGIWRMTALWDAQARSLAYEGGTMALVTYDENGEIRETDVQWDDAEGAFTLNEEGILLWNDSREERSTEFRLERIVVEAPSAETFAADYFEAVASVEAGTAGASLKQAQAACNVLRFASDNDLWIADIPALRENILAAWEGLDDETRARFDEAMFGGIASLMSEAFDDYAGVASQFEDAGVGEEMARLVEIPEARLSWETLIGRTATMGNSEE